MLVCVLNAYPEKRKQPPFGDCFMEWVTRLVCISIRYRMEIMVSPGPLPGEQQSPGLLQLMFEPRDFLR